MSYRRFVALGDSTTEGLMDPLPDGSGFRGWADRLPRLNHAIREISRRRGTFLVELDAHPVSSDRRLWNEDRLHANSEGHRRIASAAAHALGLPDTDLSWTMAFPSPLGRRSRRSHA